MERGNPLSAAAFCSVSLCENVIHVFKKGTKFEKNALLCFTLFIVSFRLFIFIFKMFPTQSPHPDSPLPYLEPAEKNLSSLFYTPRQARVGGEGGDRWGGQVVREIWGQGA